MNREQSLFCKLIRLTLDSREEPPLSEEEHKFAQESYDYLVSLALEQGILPALYDSLCRQGITISPGRQSIKNTVISYCYASYQMLAFTKKVVGILEEEQVNYYVLKGVSLLSCYPKFEFRGYGDVDILVPDSQEFKKAMRRFQAEGFQGKRDLVDHHTELLFHSNGRDYLLELHNKVIASQSSKHLNEQIVTLYADLTAQRECFPLTGLSYMALPPTENALYLLLHMLQHFLNAGFGVKLLCDWSAYLTKRGSQIDQSKFLNDTADLGLSGFCNAMTGLCVRYLGLDRRTAALVQTAQTSEKVLEDLMTDVLLAGQFGKQDASRMLILTEGTGLMGYFHELHRQMKNRFQRLHPIVPLWPLLWLLTGLCFLWNNHFLRKTKTSDFIKTAKKRQRLLGELHLFQSEGGHYEGK